MGRDAELGILRAELHAAFQGDGRLVLLGGEAGIGKTRLATAIAAEAKARGARVAWGRCHEGGGAPVYWPWLQALEALARGRSGPVADGISEVAALLRARATLPAADGDPARARFELCERVTEALLVASRAEPLLLLFDDLHWADPGSLLLLEFLAREIGASHLLALGTLRDAELVRHHDLAPHLASLVRVGRSLPLRGLARPAVASLLGQHIGAPAAESVVDEVFGVTDGNPFFVIELGHLLAADSPVAVDAGPLARPTIPPGVHEILRRRLAPLPPESLRLMQAAAVMGREFDVGTLATVLGKTPDSILDALEPALAAGLLCSSDTFRRYTFAHALMRETLYEDLTSRERARLHSVIGETLETNGPDDDLLPLLAHHFFEAARGSDPARAIRYACAAGERALKLLSFEEARRHFERAITAVGSTRNDEARRSALAGLGEAAHGAGDRDHSEAAFREAVSLARRLGPEPLARTVLAFAGTRSEMGVLDVEMNCLLEEALDGLPPDPSALRARLMARLAIGLLLQPGAEARRRILADAATEMARRLDDPVALSFILNRRLLALLGPDDPEERLSINDEILASRPGLAAELEALVIRIDDLAELGDRTGLDQALMAFARKASIHRQPFYEWTASSARTAMALLEGDYANAEAFAHQALSLGQKAQSRTAALNFAQQLFLLRGEQARLSEVEPLILSGVNETAVVPAWRCGLADFYSVSGREAEARRELEALAADDFEGLPRDMTWLTGVLLLAGVCARLRDVRRAEILYGLLRPYAGRIAVARPLVVLVGPVDERLGMLAGLLGRYEAAETHFEEALALANRMRALPWQAHIRRRRAATLLERDAPGDRERAATLLAEAESIARPLGMELLLGWIGETRSGALAGRATTLPVAVAAGSGTSARRSALLALVPRAGTGKTRPAPTDRHREPDRRTGTFGRDGGVWTFVLEGRTTRVRHMVGLAHLASLIAEPGREVHVADLVAAAYGRQRDSDSIGASHGDAGELLDGRARNDYAARLREARQELLEAESLHDLGRTEKLRGEIELLAAELARGFGLGGRPRRAGSSIERARTAVARAIRYAIERIGEHDLELAEHFRRAVRTGTCCAYDPSSRDRIHWTR